MIVPRLVIVGKRVNLLVVARNEASRGAQTFHNVRYLGTMPSAQAVEIPCVQRCHFGAEVKRPGSAARLFYSHL
jgi:hypothetical protein